MLLLEDLDLRCIPRLMQPGPPFLGQRNVGSSSEPSLEGKTRSTCRIFLNPPITRPIQSADKDCLVMGVSGAFEVGAWPLSEPIAEDPQMFILVVEAVASSPGNEFAAQPGDELIRQFQKVRGFLSDVVPINELI